MRAEITLTHPFAKSQERKDRPFMGLHRNLQFFLQIVSDLAEIEAQQGKR